MLIVLTDPSRLTLPLVALQPQAQRHTRIKRDLFLIGATRGPEKKDRYFLGGCSGQLDEVLQGVSKRLTQHGLGGEGREDLSAETLSDIALG